MTKPPGKNSVVAKDNSIIGAIAKFDLSELRLVHYCISYYDSRSSDNRTFEATVQDFKNIFPITTKDAYAVIRRAVIGVNSKPLILDDPKKTSLWTWFSGFEYFKGEGRFKFKITPEIIPYLLGLKDTFTRYRLKNVSLFRLAATWKLYENLKRWEAAREWSVSLDELKILLGVAGKYPRWSSFKQRVIDPAVDEVNEQSDLEVSWEKEKRGRRVVGIVFFIDQRQPDDVINIQNPKEGLLKALLDNGVHTKTAKNYVTKLYQMDKVADALQKVPKIKANWEKAERPCPLQKYVLGAIKTEFFQQRLFDDDQPVDEPEHKEALECWQGFNQRNKTCKVRERGQLEPVDN